VYDLVHQILTGRVDGGLNRELTLALFRDARLMHRIVEGQQKNDIEWYAYFHSHDCFFLWLSKSAKPKGVRLGYMGHLTLISEDVIGALDHFPADLRLAVAKYIPQAAWDEYVTGRYIETKKKDSSLLGGGKPVVVPSAPRPGARWRVDEEDTSPTTETSSGANGILGTRGEFRRVTSARPTRESSADFGRTVATEDEDDVEQDTSPPQVWRRRFVVLCVGAHLNLS
jgi:serine/threonine-protein phosphatase 6 regulatory subunit 3